MAVTFEDFDDEFGRAPRAVQKPGVRQVELYLNFLMRTLDFAIFFAFEQIPAGPGGWNWTERRGLGMDPRTGSRRRSQS